MSYKQLAALALAGTTLVACGCGSSSKTNTLTPTELIAKADTICARLHVEYHANGYKTTQAMARLSPRVASYEQTALAELRKLIPPASLAKDWTQILDGTRTLADDTAKLSGYAKENNLNAALPLFYAAQRVQQPMLATATKDGFKDCSQAPA